MAKKRITKQLDDFIANNSELIGEYDSTEGTFPFDYCKEEILQKIQQILKVNKGSNFKNTLENALKSSIKYQEPVLDSLETVFKESISDTGGINITQTYFNEIGEIYKKYKGDPDMEYKPENRQKLIELNTKMVISVAKRYQGMGLSLPELISAGNVGLCVAWDKYDPKKAQLKDNVINAVSVLHDEFKAEELYSIIDPIITYGATRQKFEDKFERGKTYTKEELLDWVEKHVHNAKFSSTCMLWIKAHILIEIDNHSRVVKKPKSEIYKDKEKTGSYQRETLLNLDAPIAGNTETTFADTLGMEDDEKAELNIIESYDEYKDALSKMLEGINARDRFCLLSKFGIGFPRPLTPKEIAEEQGLSLARVSQLCISALQKMRKNAAKYDIDPSSLFEAVQNFR